MIQSCKMLIENGYNVLTPGETGSGKSINAV